ncbi:MAG: hypothetical protein IPK81_24630 [Rhodospirillales bacterium]|nr:MAG: hypothetical protein IPK81_24630 [Rhodospirillales bacterium]
MSLEAITLVIVGVAAAGWTGRARRARAGDLPYRWGMNERLYLSVVGAEAPIAAVFCVLCALWRLAGLVWAALDGDKPALAAAVDDCTHAVAAAWVALAIPWLALRRRFDAESGRGV